MVRYVLPKILVPSWMNFMLAPLKTPNCEPVGKENGWTPQARKTGGRCKERCWEAEGHAGRTS